MSGTSSLQDTVSANLAQVRARIDAACDAAGRDPADVALLPVSKTVDSDTLRAAHAAGCRWFAENRVQEASAKHAALADLTDLHWVIIGHLQSNKARDVARFAHAFHALDSLPLAETLDRRLQREGRSLDVLIQVNTSDEANKSGVSPDRTAALLRQLRAFPTLRVRGLMTMAMLSDDPAPVRACFARLRTLRDRLRQDVDDPQILRELSMGMSGDFELAIAEGATIVRIGRAIFGSRG